MDLATSTESSGASAGRKRARVALAACMLLCLVGIGISWDLTRVWMLSRTDLDYHSFCAVSEGVNCETVALSSYSTVLGAPNSVWAIAGYAFAILLAGMAASRRGDTFGYGLLVALGVVFTVASLVLLYIMHFVIGSLCILCMALDVINISFLAFAIVATRAVEAPLVGSVGSDLAGLLRRPATGAAIVLAGFGMLGLAWAAGHQVVEAVAPGGGPTGGFVAAAPSVSGSCGSGGEAGNPAAPSMGVSPEGHPWIGAEKPVIEIQEFTDFQCPHCRRAHMMVRKMLSNEGNKIRLYHRHLPLDQACNPAITRPFHDRACEFSRISICAGRQGRFWEMNDFLFQQAGEIREKGMSARDIARRLELDPEAFECCMGEAATGEMLSKDVAEGNRLGIRGTPAFLVGGQIHYGKIPAEALLEAGIAGP